MMKGPGDNEEPGDEEEFEDQKEASNKEECMELGILRLLGSMKDSTVC